MHLSSSVVYSVFILIFLANILINIDHGAIPACSNSIKQKLEIGNFEFGVIGSVVFAGLTVGSAVATGIYSRSDWIKPTLVITVVLNGVSLYCFAQTDSYFGIIICRGLIGFFQVFVCIYMPVWADTFGTEKQKSVWLTVLLLAAPLGVVLGFTLAYNTQAYWHSWEWSFRI